MSKPSLHANPARPGLGPVLFVLGVWSLYAAMALIALRYVT